jgi:hypothetical protein
MVGETAADSPRVGKGRLGSSRVALADMASYLYIVCSYPYIGRRCQNIGDHLNFL